MLHRLAMHFVFNTFKVHDALKKLQWFEIHFFFFHIFILFIFETLINHEEIFLLLLPHPQTLTFSVALCWTQAWLSLL